MSSISYTALLGGSFNPPHAGHFRMALEVWETFSPTSLLFIPCAVPPHKTARNLLPFTLRVRMLEAVLRHYPGMKVSSIEQNRPGPSYTVDTLACLARAMPGQRLLFILGAEDFAQFATWNRWRHIPTFADLVVLPRNHTVASSFESTVRELWADALPLAWNETEEQAVQAFSLPDGGALFYLARPRLEISSSLLRERWIAGRSLDFLTPREIIDMLSEYGDAVTALWGITETDAP